MTNTDPTLDTLDTLRTLTEPTAEQLTGLQVRLADSASAAGILDVTYTTIDSPVGPLLLAATDRGLVRVAFQREGFDAVLQTIANLVSPRVLRAPTRLDTAARELEEYFAGRRTCFDLPLDFALTKGFRQLVQQHLPDIAYGHTETYREVAESVGNPKATRAVGSACARNPLPVVLPCHRVVRTDGAPGGYAGGPDAKLALLALEAA